MGVFGIPDRDARIEQGIVQREKELHRIVKAVLLASSNMLGKFVPVARGRGTLGAISPVLSSGLLGGRQVGTDIHQCRKLVAVRGIVGGLLA